MITARRPILALSTVAAWYMAAVLCASTVLAEEVAQQQNTGATPAAAQDVDRAQVEQHLRSIFPDLTSALAGAPAYAEKLMGFDTFTSHEIIRINIFTYGMRNRNPPSLLL